MTVDHVSGYRRVAGIVLLRQDGAAVFQHRDNKRGIPHPGMWVPPGGHCEPGESIDACARREFLEETAYRVEELRLLKEFIDRSAVGFPPMHLWIYWSVYDGVQRLVCHEGQALAFINRERAESYPIPPYLITVWDEALAAARLRTSHVPTGNPSVSTPTDGRR